ncbi:MAG: SLATT domain-containing protein [Nitrospirota bacterium]
MATSLVDEMHVEASRIEEDALYSAKSHFEAGRAWGNVHLGLGIPTVVIAAITSASAFKEEIVAAGVLAIAASVLSAIPTFLNPSKRSQLHHQAGAKYNSLRNRIRMFRDLDPKSEAGETDLLKLLKSLAQERDDLNLSSPQIRRFAYKRAHCGIESGEAAYKVDSR